MNANEYQEQVNSLGNIIARLTKENDYLRNALGMVDAYIQIQCFNLARGTITNALAYNEWRSAFRDNPDHDDSYMDRGPDNDPWDNSPHPEDNLHDPEDGCAGRLDDESEAEADDESFYEENEE